jgi:hypothetical protein
MAISSAREELNAEYSAEAASLPKHPPAFDSDLSIEIDDSWSLSLQVVGIGIDETLDDRFNLLIQHACSRVKSGTPW